MSDPRLKWAIEKFDLLDWFDREDIDWEWGTRGREIIVTCPAPDCDDISGKFWFNILKNIGLCYLCGKVYGMVELMAALKGLPREAIEGVILGTTRRGYGVKLLDVKDRATKIQEGRRKANPSDPIPHGLPESFKALTGEETSNVGRKAWDYLTGRGIPEEVILRWELGYCYRGEAEFRIVVPLRDEDERLVYWVGRDFLGYQQPKVRNPVKMDGYYGKSDLVVNIHRVAPGSRLVITEGVFDTMAVENGIGLLGSTVSDKQRSIIRRWRPREIVILLDRDAYVDGKALKMASTLLTVTPEVKVIELPDKRDAGDYGLSGTAGIVEAAPRRDIRLEQIKQKAETARKRGK